MEEGAEGFLGPVSSAREAQRGRRSPRSHRVTPGRAWALPRSSRTSPRLLPDVASGHNALLGLPPTPAGTRKTGHPPPERPEGRSGEVWPLCAAEEERARARAGAQNLQSLNNGISPRR